MEYQPFFFSLHITNSYSLQVFCQNVSFIYKTSICICHWSTQSGHNIELVIYGTTKVGAFNILYKIMLIYTKEM